MVRSAQTVNLYCTNTNTVSKRTETRFHKNHSPRSSIVCPRWFLSIWNVRHKPRTYIVSRLALSPNELKRASTWASSPRSTIGCIQNDFWAYGMFSAHRAPILRQDLHHLQTEQNELRLEPHHLGVPSGASKSIYVCVACLEQTVQLSCTDTNTISKKTETRFHMNFVT
jgi:hypothetical protein